MTQGVCTGPALTRARALAFMLCFANLEFLVVSEQGAVCFHFALDPTKSVAAPGSWCLYILSHLILTNHLQGAASIIPIAQSRTSRISKRSHVL